MGCTPPLASNPDGTPDPGLPSGPPAAAVVPPAQRLRPPLPRAGDGRRPDLPAAAEGAGVLGVDVQRLAACAGVWDMCVHAGVGGCVRVSRNTEIDSRMSCFRLTFCEMGRRTLFEKENGQMQCRCEGQFNSCFSSEE